MTAACPGKYPTTGVSHSYMETLLYGGDGRQPGEEPNLSGVAHYIETHGSISMSGEAEDMYNEAVAYLENGGSGSSGFGGGIIVAGSSRPMGTIISGPNAGHVNLETLETYMHLNPELYSEEAIASVEAMNDANHARNP